VGSGVSRLRDRSPTSLSARSDDASFPLNMPKLAPLHWRGRGRDSAQRRSRPRPIVDRPARKREDATEPDEGSGWLPAGLIAVLILIEAR
jgi:hypothetical protein